MMLLNAINVMVLGFTGVAFGILGSNVQSRIFGIVALSAAIANIIVPLMQ